VIDYNSTDVAAIQTLKTIPIKHGDSGSSGELTPHRLTVPGGLVCEYRDPDVLYALHEIFYHDTYDAARHARRAFDCGANIGLFSLWSSASGCDKIVALEPDPRNFSQLVTNITLNKLQNKIVPVNKAVYSTSGWVTLKLGRTGAWSSVEQTHAPEDADVVRVPSITLDDASLEYQLDVDTIKIDTEGAEYEVLKGARETLQTCRTVVLEYHSPPLLADCQRLLINAGFTTSLRRRDRVRWSRPKGYLLLNARQLRHRVSPDVFRRFSSTGQAYAQTGILVARRRIPPYPVPDGPA
jgi:FkbM family methyltransferase